MVGKKCDKRREQEKGVRGPNFGTKKGNGGLRGGRMGYYGFVIDEKKTQKTILTVYNNAGVTRVKERIEVLLEQGLKRSKDLMVIGDWNARIGGEQARTELNEEEESPFLDYLIEAIAGQATKYRRQEATRVMRRIRINSTKWKNKRGHGR